MRQFSEIIDERRRQLGLTVEQVYAKVEQFPWPAGSKMPALATVGHWFNGTRKRPRDMNHIRAICDALDLQIGEAFGEESLQAQTDMEQLVLKRLRTLSVKDQELALTLLEGLNNRGNG